jgi:tetratricopeptide (TPR) repeat protein
MRRSKTWLALFLFAAGPSLAEVPALAQAAFEAGQFREAISQCQRQLQRAPDDVETITMLASAYAATGHLDRAQEQAQLALKYDRRSVDALILLGRLSNRAQEWAAAREWFEQALGEDASRSEAYAGLSQSLIGMGDNAGAEQATENYMKLLSRHKESL